MSTLLQLILSLLSSAPLFPTGTSCADGNPSGPTVSATSSGFDELAVSIAFDVNTAKAKPEYIVAVLSESNLIPTRFAAIHAKDEGSALAMTGAFKVMVYALSSLTKNSLDPNAYFLPKISVKTHSPFTVSVFGYNCNALDDAYSSKLVVAHSDGILQRFGGSLEWPRTSVYHFSEPGKGYGVTPTTTNITRNALLTIPEKKCVEGCYVLVTGWADTLGINLRRITEPRKKMQELTIIKGFPKSGAKGSAMIPTASTSQMAFVVLENGRYHLVIQDKPSSGVDYNVVVLASSNFEVGGGVKASEGMGSYSAPINDPQIEEAVDRITDLITNNSAGFSAVLNDANYLRYKLMAYTLLQENSFLVGTVSDLVAYLKGAPNLVTESDPAKRYDILWDFLRDRNKNAIELSYGNFKRIDSWGVTAVVGVYSRLGLTAADIGGDVKAGKDAKFATVKLNLQHSSNVLLFFRNADGSFTEIGGEKYPLTDETWVRSVSTDARLVQESFSRGYPTWSKIIEKGLWIRPVENYDLREFSAEDAGHYQVRISRVGSTDPELLMVGDVSGKDMLGIPDARAKRFPKGSDYLARLPYNYRFQIVSKGDYSYGVDRSMIDDATYTPSLACKLGCTDIQGMIAERRADDLHFQSPDISSNVNQVYDYTISQTIGEGTTAKLTDKYIAKIPLSIFASHKFIVTGYGSASDVAVRRMEGLAELYARNMVQANAAQIPELIRIRPFYGLTERNIDLSATFSDRGFGVSFYELNKMFAEGKTKEISFFGHGGVDGLSLGQTSRGSLGFYYGIDYWQASPFPAFEGTMQADANVNLFECYGATYFKKVIRTISGRSQTVLDPIRATDVVLGEPGLIHPIAEAIARTWHVNVLGLNWLAAPVVPKKADNGIGWGLFSAEEGTPPSAPIQYYWNCNAGVCTEVKFLGTSTGIESSSYDQLGTRTNAIFPVELRAKASTVLPLGLSIDCLNGHGCSWEAPYEL